MTQRSFSSLWHQLGYVIFLCLSSVFEDDKFLIGYLKVRFQVEEVVLLNFDERLCLLRLFVKLLLSINQVFLQLNQTRVVDIADIHLGQRSQLA